jgi:plasmid stabilization system protein ParE
LEAPWFVRVRYTERARSDLAKILDDIDQRSPQGAHNVKLALRSTVRLVGLHPEIGRRSGVGDTRVIAAGRYPYLIYWTTAGGTAWLVHIRHAARAPWTGE